MSYVPPHKRHSNDAIRPSSSVPRSVLPKFKTAYAEDCISRWLVACSNGTEGNSTPSAQFSPVSIESAEWWTTRKPLVLVNNNTRQETDEVRVINVRTPWVSMADKVEEDLLLAFERAKNGVKHSVREVVKLICVARFGKFLFDGRPTMNIEGLQDEPVVETKLLRSKKWLHTNLPSSYVEKVKYEAVPEVGLQVEGMKDIYYVLLSDKNRPDETFFCKCIAKEDKRLHMYKVEGFASRHLVIDVSCLDQNLDLRLLVDSKKILIAPREDEFKSMKELIDAAIIDPNVKGGLKWPLAKASSSGNRYSVRSIWHTITTSYSDSTLRLKVREADRFDFITGIGSSACEVFFILKGISVNLLQEGKLEKSLISDILKDALRKIWDNFLSCDPFLT